MHGFHPQLLEHFLQDLFAFPCAEPVHAMSDKYPFASLRDHATGCFELGIGFGHRGGVYGQLRGQFTDRGKLFSGIQEACRHHMQDLIPDLTIHRQPGMRIDS